MEKKIDKEYMGNLKEKRRISQIADIDRMLAEMSHGQVENVHKYVTDEYIEPNHEAEALQKRWRPSCRSAGSTRIDTA